MSWQATDAVLRIFPRKTKRAEFDAMIVIAHHYNEQQQHSFPNFKTIAQEVGCSKRWAIKLIGRLIAREDISLIAKGGRARGDPNIYRIAPKYLQERVNNAVHPSGEKRVNAAVHKKGERSCAHKGELPKRETGRKVLKQKESAAAASAVAGPPPPLLTPQELADVEMFQRTFEKEKGRKLLGAK
jgi:hypothetical protein